MGIGRRVSLACALCAGASTAWASNAEPMDVTLSYEADRGCPSDSEFALAVHRRTKLPTFTSGRGGVRVRARLDLHADGAGGKVEIVDVAGRTTLREVTATTCAEVVSALALATALALDPQAGLDEPVSEGVPPRAPEAPSAPTAPETAAAARTAEPKAPSVVRLGAGVHVVTGVLPNAAVAPVLFFDPAPFVRIALEGSLAASDQPVPDAASFQWLALPVTACPFTWKSARLSLAPCVFGELGLLRGRGIVVADPKARTRPLYALGVTGRALLDLSPWFVELDAGARFPLVQDQFRFDSGASVHSARPGVDAGLDVGIAWP
jgi:hypothetical protein